MLSLLRRLAALRGPVGVLAAAVGLGAFTGIVVTHLVLAAWTYRDAARRDLRAPRRWALAVLAAGVFAFVPYLLVQRASALTGGRLGGSAPSSSDERGADPDRVPAADEDGTSHDRERTAGEDGAVLGPGPAHSGRSLASTAARVGWKGARLGGRGARWAAGRALGRLLD